MISIGFHRWLTAIYLIECVSNLFFFSREIINTGGVNSSAHGILHWAGIFFQKCFFFFGIYDDGILGMKRRTRHIRFRLASARRVTFRHAKLHYTKEPSTVVEMKHSRSHFVSWTCISHPASSFLA
jgi:hypothetical protein